MKKCDPQCPMDCVYSPDPDCTDRIECGPKSDAISDFGSIAERLRGQLQNCVNHLEQAKRNSHGKERQSYEKAIDSANKALYETLGI